MSLSWMIHLNLEFNKAQVEKDFWPYPNGIGQQLYYIQNRLSTIINNLTITKLGSPITHLIQPYPCFKVNSQGMSTTSKKIRLSV